MGKGRKSESKERDRKGREEGLKLCTLHPWAHQEKRKVHPAILVYPRPHLRRGKGEKN